MVFFRRMIYSLHFCEALQKICLRTAQSRTVLKYKVDLT